MSLGLVFSFFYFFRANHVFFNIKHLSSRLVSSSSPFFGFIFFSFFYTSREGTDHVVQRSQQTATQRSRRPDDYVQRRSAAAAAASAQHHPVDDDDDEWWEGGGSSRRGVLRSACRRSRNRSERRGDPPRFCRQAVRDGPSPSFRTLCRRGLQHTDTHTHGPRYIGTTVNVSFTLQ